jgi:hypothetical protein
MKYWHYILIASALLVGLLVWNYNRRQTVFVNSYKAGKEFTAADAQAALAVVKNRYGLNMAKKVEQLARLETGHFTSQQYCKTGTGGMKALGPAPYYGWFSTFFVQHPSYMPIGTTQLIAKADQLGDPGGNYSWVIMPSVEAWMMFLADYATRYADKGGIYRWASTDPQIQSTYASYMAQISTPFTNALA